MSYSLRLLGDPVLEQPSVPVEPGTDLGNLIPEMRRILAEQKGLGLAAPQVGSLHRIALMRFSSGEVVVAINLEVRQRSLMRQMSIDEGCLSVQHKGKFHRVNIKRHRQVTAAWQDVDTGEIVVRRLSGLDAILVQHECDHLDGRCVVGGTDPKQRAKAMRFLETGRA